MEGLVLEEKNAGDWAYRGEGACNLVLAYTGSSPSFVNKKHLKFFAQLFFYFNNNKLYVCAYVCVDGESDAGTEDAAAGRVAGESVPDGVE